MIFHSAGKNDTKMESCRNMTVEAMRTATKSRIDDILKNADETLTSQRMSKNLNLNCSEHSGSCNNDRKDGCPIPIFCS